MVGQEERNALIEKNKRELNSCWVWYDGERKDEDEGGCQWEVNGMWEG